MSVFDLSGDSTSNPLFQPIVSSLASGQRVIEYPASALGLTGTLVGTTTFTCNMVPTMAMPQAFLTCTSTQTGNMTLVRYSDKAGTVQTATVTQVMTANAAATITFSDGTFHQAALLSFTNSATTAATLTNFLFAFLV